VIGRRFVVTWLSGAFGTINAANTLMNDLSELVRTDLTALDTPEPELAYLFKHVVTQEVAYNSLSASTRAMLHEQLGLYLETLTSDTADQHIDLLAYHFDRSNNLAKRRIYLRRAGEAAIARFANEAALSYLNRAVELADESDLNERFDLLMAREQVYEYLARRDEQLADLATLTDLAVRLDDRRRQALVAERRALHAVRTNDFAAVEQAVQQAVALAREAGADEIAASAYIRWAWALGDHSDAAGARAKAEAALELAEAAGAHQRAAVALYTIGVIAEQQGEYASARAALLRALEVCHTHGYRREEAMVLTYLTNLSGSVGEFAAGASYADQALAILRAIGYPHGETIVLGYLGALAQQQGDYSKARGALEQALRLNRRRAHRLGESYCLHCLGVLADSVGDYEQARSLYDQALEIRQTLKDRWAEGATRAGLALLLHHQDDHAGALEQAQQALAIGRAVASLPGQAAALTVSGHALLALERPDEAEQSYREALELRRALGQTHLRVEALAGLARVALARANPVEALGYVDTIMAEQPLSTFDGTDEPLRIGLTCCEVLAALGDERAPALLAHHQRQIQARAAALPDERLRQRFAELVAQLQAAHVQQ
jgi:tetratricopeptide (TPR) repeat protein